MTTRNFLDKTGLGLLWAKCKNKFSLNWIDGSSTWSSHTRGASHSASNYTIGDYSVAEGHVTHADGTAAHSEGYTTYANGDYSHVEGAYSSSGGEASHAEGYSTESSGDYSHAGGRGSKAARKSQTVIGEYNIVDNTGADETEKGEYAFIIGNGTSNNARSNAMTVDWDGNAELEGRSTTDDMTSQEVEDFVDDVIGELTSGSKFAAISSSELYALETELGITHAQLSRLYSIILNIVNNAMPIQSPTYTLGSGVIDGAYNQDYKIGNLAVGVWNFNDSSPSENKIIASGFYRPKKRIYYIYYVGSSVVKVYLDVDGTLRWGPNRITNNHFTVPYTYVIDS